MKQPAKFRTRVYYASLTAERLLILGGVGLASISLVGIGIGMNFTGSSAGNGFMGLGLAFLVLAGFLFGRTHRRTLRLTEDSISSDGVEIPWCDVKEFAADPESKRWFRVAVVGDGSKDLVVDSYTFREYDQIVSLVEVAIRTHWRGAGGGPKVHLEPEGGRTGESSRAVGSREARGGEPVRPPGGGRQA